MGLLRSDQWNCWHRSKQSGIVPGFLGDWWGSNLNAAGQFQHTWSIHQPTSACAHSIPKETLYQPNECLELHSYSSYVQVFVCLTLFQPGSNSAPPGFETSWLLILSKEIYGKSFSYCMSGRFRAGSSLGWGSQIEERFDRNGWCYPQISS